MRRRRGQKNSVTGVHHDRELQDMVRDDGSLLWGAG